MMMIPDEIRSGVVFEEGVVFIPRRLFMAYQNQPDVEQYTSNDFEDARLVVMLDTDLQPRWGYFVDRGLVLEGTIFDMRLLGQLVMQTTRRVIRGREMQVAGVMDDVEKEMRSW